MEHVGFGSPATSPKSCEPRPFCAGSFPPPLSSFPSRFLCSWYPIQGQCLPKSRYWLEQTALQRLFSGRVSPVVFDCLQPITSRPREKLASTPTPCGMIENMSHATLERSANFECVSSCCRHQSVMSGIQNVLLISIGSEW